MLQDLAERITDRLFVVYDEDVGHGAKMGRGMITTIKLVPSRVLAATSFVLFVYLLHI